MASGLDAAQRGHDLDAGRVRAADVLPEPPFCSREIINRLANFANSLSYRLHLLLCCYHMFAFSSTTSVSMTFTYAGFGHILGRSSVALYIPFRFLRA